jgi:hypothetical protein
MPDGTGQDPVTNRPLSRDDFPLLQRWLAMPHVQAWWGSDAGPSAIYAVTRG